MTIHEMGGTHKHGIVPALGAGSSVVIKLGGAALAGAPIDPALAGDVADLAGSGVRTLVVHGGGADISALARSLGVESTFVDGQRVTDDVMIDVVTMTLAGRVNKRVVELLRASGANAIGLSGLDGGLLQAERYKPGGVDLGRVGRVTRVDRELLAMLMGRGYVPVIAPLGLGAEGALNVNADLAAGAIAGALDAALLVYLSDVPGVRVDGRVAATLTVSDAQGLIADGIVTGGMIPKVNSALEALDRGVAAVAIVDGSEPGLLRRLVAGEPIGTRLIRNERATRAHARMVAAA